MPSKASTATRAMGMSGAPVKMAQFYPMSAIGSIVPRRVGQQHGPSPSTETKSMSKRTVLVVDLQNDYLPTGKFPLVGIGAAIDNAARVIADARAKGDRVVHVRHEFPGPDAPFFAPGNDGPQLHSSVAPAGAEPVTAKNRINSFRGPNPKPVLATKR